MVKATIDLSAETVTLVFNEPINKQSFDVTQITLQGAGQVVPGVSAKQLTGHRGVDLNAELDTVTIKMFAADLDAVRLDTNLAVGGAIWLEHSDKLVVNRQGIKPAHRCLVCKSEGEGDGDSACFVGEGEDDGASMITLTKYETVKHEKHRLKLTPVGQWIDVKGGFLCGAVLTFADDGTGEVTLDGVTMPLKIACVYDEDGRLSEEQFSIDIPGDNEDQGNRFVRRGNILPGTYFDGAGVTECTLEDYGPVLAERRRLEAIPVGLWVDTEQGFLCGQVITIDRHGDGRVELDGQEIPLRVVVLKDKTSQDPAHQQRAPHITFDIPGDEDEEGNEFTLIDGSLQGSYYDGSARVTCKLDNVHTIQPQIRDASPLWSPGSDVYTPSPRATPNNDDLNLDLSEIINVGDRVIVNRKRRGVVRFKGETSFRPGSTLYGVALDLPEGKHNGTVVSRALGYGLCLHVHTETNDLGRCLE